MLKKLVKYDLIWINKIMIVYFIISLILSILTRTMSYFNNSFIGNIIFQILRGAAISSYFSSLITCAIRIWVRFRNNTYKDESYLTHTLPVSKETMYNSKIMSSGILILMSLMVILLGFIIAFLNKDLINAIKIIFSNNGFIIIGMIMTFILEVIYMVNCGLLGILIGHKKNSNRMVKSILIGIVLYFMIQLIILGIIYLIGYFNTDISVLFKEVTDTIMNSSFRLLIILVDILYVVFIGIMYFIGKMIYKKGVNVE